MQTQTEEHTTEQRFDGDANAHVQVFNPTNETWNTSYRIERNGSVVLDTTHPVRSEQMWEVTTIEQPGNYTFTIATGNWTDSVAVRLPAAVGDRNSYVETTEMDGEFSLRVRVAQ
ncbi:hypothetical protein [Halorhabdus salina]|uniref:hypothetical protein n=1 Tax=Halorhabdus salina TaxID=2750670 RepID=UPI0015EE9BBA|nr:hypothetical protein [Halorhabdus salina]